MGSSRASNLALISLLLANLTVGCSPRVASVHLSTHQNPLRPDVILVRHDPVFALTDESAHLRVVFHTHLGGWIREYEVEWSRPDGTIYSTKRVRKTGHVLVVSLPIADEEPSRTPGNWRVSLREGETTIVDLDFTIR